MKFNSINESNIFIETMKMFRTIPKEDRNDLFINETIKKMVKLDLKIKKPTDFYAYIGVCLCRWKIMNRPFYRICPEILKSFLDMDFKNETPFQDSELNGCFLIELPVGSEIDFDGQKMTNVLVDFIEIDGKKYIYTSPIFGNLSNYTGSLWTAEEMDGMLSVSDEVKNIASAKVIRLIAGCLFIEDKPELLSPIVLRKDEEKFNVSQDEEYRKRLIEKARRLGINGYIVGLCAENQEKEGSSKRFHIRRGHCALYHIGQGRKKTVIRWIKTMTINAKKATEIPGDFYDKGDKK